ncbi:MAG: HEPN domain-containing protein [Sarcina sp.]
MESIRFGGTWNIPGVIENLSGDIQINNKEGLIALKIYNLDKTLLRDNLEIINGTLTDGRKITLIDCTILNIKFDLEKREITLIEAKYAINDIAFQSLDDITFYKMSFKVSNIIKWSGLSGFYTSNINEMDYCLEYKLKEPIEYNIDDKTKIIFLPKFNPSNIAVESEDVTLEQSVWINIISEDEKSMEDTMEILSKVLNLVRLGSEKKVDILKVKAYPTEDRNNFIEIFTDGKIEDSYEEFEGETLFRLEDLINRDENLLSNWFLKYELLEPIIELYLSTLYYGYMSTKRKFLNIVQALEAYHMRFCFNDGPLFVEKIEELFKDNEEKDRHYKEFKTINQKRKKSIFLKNRLSDLMIEQFGLDIYLRDEEKIQNFLRLVVDTRNYHTHYSLEQKDRILIKGRLKEAIYILKSILEYNLLKEIGFSHEEMEEKVIRRIELASELYGYDEVEEKSIEAIEALEILQEEIDDDLTVK